MKSTIKISLIMTGDELMSGDITDTNSTAIAQSLSQLGLRIWKRTTVGDNSALLSQEFCKMAEENDLVIVNGGLGPTIDDYTSEAAAKAVKQNLKEHPAALAHLKDCERLRGLTLNSANLKQAILPEEADILPNRIGTAVGFRLKIQNCLFYFTPGPPHELFPMMEEVILPHIQEQFPNLEESQTFRLFSFGLGESNIQNRLTPHLHSGIFETTQLGFRAAPPYVEIKVTGTGEQISHIQNQILPLIQKEIGDHLFSQGSIQSLPDQVRQLLTEQKKKLTIAESCTGGLISSQLTQLSGASQVFTAGVVAYDYPSKSTFLGIQLKELENFGAVSEEITRRTVERMLQKTEADYALAVSGIAGPEGGTKEKPVGTVFIGWGNQEQIQVRKLQIRGDRQRFQLFAATTAFDLLRRSLSKQRTDAPYFFDQLSPKT